LAHLEARRRRQADGPPGAGPGLQDRRRHPQGHDPGVHRGDPREAEDPAVREGEDLAGGVPGR
ncbi:unnamed protein product, partial [Heterosigma akashiwo]